MAILATFLLISPISSANHNIMPVAPARMPSAQQIASNAELEKTLQSTKKARQKQKELSCLASAIWHEAGNQPREGRIAVAEVVLTRTKSRIYPNHACAVIAQRHQFSFVQRGHIPAVPDKYRKEMMRLAKGVLNGRFRSRVKGAISFHATYVNPGWNAPVMGRIGDHIFYGKSI